MSVLEILFIIYLAFCVIGAIIQTFIEAREYRKSFSGWLLIILIIFPLMIFYNIFVTPLIGINHLFKYQKNPIPETFNINYNKNIETALLGMGFEKADSRVTSDNIPYSGFAYWYVGERAIILAFDFKDKEILRCSIYIENNTTKIIAKQLKNLEEVQFESEVVK